MIERFLDTISIPRSYLWKHFKNGFKIINFKTCLKIKTFHCMDESADDTHYIDNLLLVCQYRNHHLVDWCLEYYQIPLPLIYIRLGKRGSEINNFRRCANSQVAEEPHVDSYLQRESLYSWNLFIMFNIKWLLGGGGWGGEKIREEMRPQTLRRPVARPLGGAEVLVAVRGPSPGERGGKKNSECSKGAGMIIGKF